MTELVRYDNARRALAEAHRVDEVKSIRDKAVAMQAYARQAKDMTLIRQATDIRLRAERRAGELLIEMAERDERPRGRKKESHVATLSDLGVTKSQSSRWQALAALNADIFEAKVERQILEAAQVIRARKLEERRAERLARVAALADPGPLPQGRKYPVVLADPPWRFEFSQTSSRAVENHYPTMVLAEICALPVPDLMAPIGALFLVCPSAIREQAHEVVRAWGLSYRTDCIWDKSDGIGQGHWFRQQHEEILLAIRGDMPPPPPHLRPPSVLRAPRSEHSEKPDVLYEMIERMYPDLPRIELFARRARPGWDRWGNEARAESPHPLDIPECLKRRAAP
jgi:N6-adenosine-specific RNA methylase IME4